MEFLEIATRGRLSEEGLVIGLPSPLKGPVKHGDTAGIGVVDHRERPVGVGRVQRAGDEQFELWIRIHAETHAAGGVGDLDHRLQSVVVVRHRPLVPEAVAADTLFKLVLHSASHGQHSLDHRRVVEYRGDTD